MIPIRFARNSTVTDLRIYRAESKREENQVRKLTLAKKVEDLEMPSTLKDGFSE